MLPVGGNRPRPVDVRVLAATHRDLKIEIAQGRFREDLYFRLAVIPIRLPPLRERREDILPLARHFLQRSASELERPLTGWSPETEALLLAHRWPGNVRELENALERAVVLSAGPWIEPEDLLIEAPAAEVSNRDSARPAAGPSAAPSRVAAPSPGLPLEPEHEPELEPDSELLPESEHRPVQSLPEFLDRVAAERIRAVLAAQRGARAETARQLGIDRTTLYRLMKKLEIH